MVAISPSAYSLQQLAVGPGLVEEPLHRGARGEPEEVVHPLGVLGQQRHVGVGAGPGDVVVTAVVPAHPLLVEARGVGGEVGLHADDRLDPGGLGLGPEVVGAEHVAVVGHRDRVHAQLGGPLEHVAQPGRTVQHGVLGVDVEVDETVPASGHGGRSALPGASGWTRQCGPGVTPGGAGEDRQRTSASHPPLTVTRAVRRPRSGSRRRPRIVLPGGEALRDHGVHHRGDPVLPEAGDVARPSARRSRPRARGRGRPAPPTSLWSWTAAVSATRRASSTASSSSTASMRPRR